MLVCSVSLQPPRTISADIAEIAAAAAVATGHIASVFGDIVETADAVATHDTEAVIFPVLVDDPASAADIVNGYLGENMQEAASAADVVSAGSASTAAIDEDLTATESVDGSTASTSTRSALLAAPWPIFVNPGASRQANAGGVMVNL